MSSFDSDPRIVAAKARKRAAEAEIEAVALSMTSEQKGCSEPTCPGPYVGDGGCPLGWAGSCRRSRS